MFLDKYLNETYLDLLYDKYEKWYINEIDETNFNKIYMLFKQYEFYFIEDIIINYLEIFNLSKEIVEQGIITLKEKLGDNFVWIIGNDISYLEGLL